MPDVARRALRAAVAPLPLGPLVEETARLVRLTPHAEAAIPVARAEGPAKASAEDWRRVLDVNLAGTFNAIQVFGPAMVAANHAHS